MRNLTDRLYTSCYLLIHEDIAVVTVFDFVLVCVFIAFYYVHIYFVVLLRTKVLALRRKLGSKSGV